MSERDSVLVRGIRGKGFHGVFPEERRDGQEFVVDVELFVDLARPGRSDDLDHTVNYADVAADALAHIEGEPFDLIESLAEAIAHECLARPLVESVVVSVHKPQAPVPVPFDDIVVRVSRRRRPTALVIAVGANLGDPVATVTSSVECVRETLRLTDVHVSPLFRTAPVGGPEQPAYVNAVITARTRLAAPHVLRLLHEIEADHGRTREVRWGARTLDLDLVQFGTPGEPDEVLSDAEDLRLPHPRAHERGFVLAPWAATDPGAQVRIGDTVVTVAERLRVVGAGGVERLGDTVTRREIRAATLLGTGTAIAIVSAAVWALVARGGRLVPEPPVMAGVLLLAIAVVTLWAAWPVRRWVRGRARKRLDPLRATRVLVLAQSAALTGAMAVGWYAGALAVTLGRLSLQVNHGRAWQLVGMVVVALALVAAGLLAQSWCRVPPRDDDTDADGTPDHP